MGTDNFHIRCSYDISDTNEEIQIINDRNLNGDNINKEISSRITILNNNLKEKLIFKKKFNKIGNNTIDFNIEGKLSNMSYMFSECKNLIKIEFISINTSDVNSMKGMFMNCEELKYINLSDFDTSAVEDMTDMFKGCNRLTEIKGITNFKISKKTKTKDMFEDCPELDYLNILENKIIIDTHKLISKSKDNENSIAVMFRSIEQLINFATPCNPSDKFSKIEKKLFKEYPELKQKKLEYYINEKLINKSLTLKQNNINNSDTIMINIID